MEWKKKGFLTSHHPLSSLEIQRYFQNEPKFKDIYSRNNLPNISKNDAYLVALNEYESTETQWVSSCGIVWWECGILW